MESLSQLVNQLASSDEGMERVSQHLNTHESIDEYTNALGRLQAYNDMYNHLDAWSESQRDIRNELMEDGSMAMGSHNSLQFIHGGQEFKLKLMNLLILK
jgi:hypothetical protein